jgi:hypothetical protein
MDLEIQIIGRIKIKGTNIDVRNTLIYLRNEIASIKIQINGK